MQNSVSESIKLGVIQSVQQLTKAASSQIIKAPMVASSWLSWMSIFITWTGVFSSGIRASKPAKAFRGTTIGFHRKV